jgi:hypothetical protein
LHERESCDHGIDGLAAPRERAVCDKEEVSALSLSRIDFEVRHALPHGIVEIGENLMNDALDLVKIDHHRVGTFGDP